MKIAVLPNITKDSAVMCTASIIDELNFLGAEVHMMSEMRDAAKDKKIYFHDKMDSLMSAVDALVVIGGDGTIIKYAKQSAFYGKPVLGVNFGRVGYVAGLEPSELHKLEKVVSGDYFIEKRMILKVTVKNSTGEKVFYALNEANVSREITSRIIDLEVSLNNNKICSYRADGLLLSTPTGSTAYAFSAGGPVVQPDVECIILVPICSYSMFSRPIIFNSYSKLEIKAAIKSENDAYLIIDGSESVKISPEDTIEVEKADVYTELIKINDKNFYEILNEKMHDLKGR